MSNRGVILGGMDHGSRLWPVLLLLLLAVLIPTVCLLWFMNEAISSQRRAAEQELTEAYRGQMSLAGEGLQRYWERSAAALDEATRGRSGAALFEHCIRSGLADAVLCLNEKIELVYPASPAAPTADAVAERPEWKEAQRVEEREGAVAGARAYAGVARSAVDLNLRARAWQAQGRCLLRAGKREEAIQLVVEHLGPSGYGTARDAQGRLIAADAALLALQLMQGPMDRRFLPVAQRLRGLLLDYQHVPVSGGHRLFLMREMLALKTPADLTQFPTFEAEDLAARFAEAEPRPVVQPVLRRTQLPDIWAITSPNGRVLALLRTQTVAARNQVFLNQQKLSSGLRVLVNSPGAQAPTAQALYSTTLAAPLPGWTLALVIENRHPFEKLSRRRAQIYVWVGLLVIATVAVLALMAARLLRRRILLARLKTDLVASVSHELRTPLASMRLLVDTLLEDEILDPVKTREYLALVAAENTRLSRLIENFLAFSRIERNKYTLELAPVDPAVIVAGAVEAAGERFHSADCTLEIAAPSGLPRVRADAGALVAALVNLLDNAYKYTPGEKRLALRVSSRNGAVCFDVADNGIGLAPKECQKVFQKFYQVDRRLSRGAGGCGLGLSIVDYIVKAHGGLAAVSSEPGKGSVFTVSIPVGR